MRNLITFFQRFRVFLVFAFLQVVALSMYFSFLNYPNARFLTTTNGITSVFMEMRFSITQHFHLEQANMKLQEENIQLRRQLTMSFIPLQSGLYKIDDTLYSQQYTYLPAAVINSTFDKENNYLTINAGHYQGIKEGMGVFNEDGIVGIIFSVSDHYSLVKSLLTSKINLDVLLPNGSFGLLKWDGRDPTLAQVTGIANDIKIKKGDLVVSRGSKLRFPKNYPVGRIHSFNRVNGNSLWEINIKLAVDFRKITHVYIIKNLLDTEQEKLEQQAQ